MIIPTLATERLILRPFNLMDASVVKGLAGAFEVADTTQNIAHPYPDGMAEAWIAGHQHTYEHRQGVSLAITLAATGTLTGAISLMDMEAGHQAELGYWLGVPYWNQGICTEAGRALVEFAQGTLSLTRLHARHLSRNPASGRVLLKLGFVHEETRKNDVEKWGQLEGAEYYGCNCD